MSTAEPIIELRAKMHLRQDRFAAELGTTITTVSRWENGRAPSRPFLKKLAALAKREGDQKLAALFDALWQASIVSAVENLPSAQTTRRIPAGELSGWAEWQESIVYNAKHLIESLTPEYNPDPPDPAHLKGVLMAILHMAARTGAEIELHQNPPTRVKWSDLSQQAREIITKPLDAETIAWGNRTNKDMQKKLDKLWGKTPPPEQVKAGE